MGLFEFGATSGATAWNAQTFALHGRPELADAGDACAVRDAALSATDRARFDAWA